jgi:NAD(P)-dependent dehydrogenase (short-subunit alcohol dehydrogenase family)
MDVEGHVAIVTGAGSGLGRVIAMRFAALGATVVVVDVKLAAANRVSEEIVAEGGCAQPVCADVCDDADLEAVLECAERLGGVQILVNNAGGWGTAGRQFPAASATEWGAVLDLNLRAPMALTQRCLVPMERAGAGAVVNIASSAGWTHEPCASPEYGAAKAGLIRFTTALGDLHKTSKVRVNCIVPGWIGLDRAVEELAAMPPAQRASMPNLIPPEDIAATVERFVADDTLSGQIAILDGRAPLRLADLSSGG